MKLKEFNKNFGVLFALLTGVLLESFGFFKLKMYVTIPFIILIFLALNKIEDYFHKEQC